MYRHLYCVSILALACFIYSSHYNYRARFSSTNIGAVPELNPECTEARSGSHWCRTAYRLNERIAGDHAKANHEHDMKKKQPEILKINGQGKTAQKIYSQKPFGNR